MRNALRFCSLRLGHGHFMNNNAQILIQRKLAGRLAELQTKNPSYSLRSFARKLGMNSGALSTILAGKRSVSAKLASKILAKLDTDPAEQAEILKFFPAKRLNRPQQTVAQLEYLQLSSDQYNILSDWYHLAILSLVRTQDFSGDPADVAARLGIRPSQAASALERLERNELLKRNEAGLLVRTHERITSSDEIANSALRKAHGQNLELARKSLEEDEVEIRDFTAITMPSDPTKLAQAKALIRRFQDELSSLLESGDSTEVYRFSTQLIPLSRRRNSK